MNNDLQNRVVTVVLGGAAGEGARAVGVNLAKLLAENGLEAFAASDYPSLIRGGHNFSSVSFSREKVHNHYAPIDVLVVFNKWSVKYHTENLKDDAIILAPGFSHAEEEQLGDKAITLPMDEFAKELGAPSITRTSVALGALSYVLDIPLELTVNMLRAEFGKTADVNVAMAEKGFAHMESLGIKHANNIELGGEKKGLLNASTTFSQGMVKAGLDFYVAYPMTPASPVLHYLAKNQKEFGMKVVHPENELSVLNMALGVAFTGKRTAIGTAGGGFALMQESFSLAGISEVPMVVMVAMRQAPGTGVPTYTSQGDMLFTLFAGHGEFPRIVIAPGDAEESFYYGADALNLAWKYQLPVIFLVDKHLTESSGTGVIDEGRVQKVEAKWYDGPGEEYGRYKVTEDGISPIAVPGYPGAVVKATSYEHDEKGETTEDAEMTKTMMDKRFAKMPHIAADMANFETVKVYGDPKSKNVITFWGSTKGALLEAVKYVDKPVKLVQIVWLEPFDIDTVKRELEGADKIINVEQNREAQLATLIRARTAINVDENITRYDARTFEPMKLAEEINKLLA